MAKQTNGYGLVMSRRSRESIAILGPATLRLLDGEFDAIVLSPGAPIFVGEALHLAHESIVIVTQGRAKIGIKADPTTHILRGELLGPRFNGNPYMAALANVDWDSYQELQMKSSALTISHIRRYARSMCPSAA